MVKPGQEALLLFVFGNVEPKLKYHRSVTSEVLFLISDRPKTIVPDRLQIDFARQFLCGQYLRVNANDKYFFVLAPIKNSNAPTLRQTACSAPKKVMVKFLAGRPLETEDLTTGRVNALHDRSDRAVLAGSIHRLEYDQQRVAITGRQYALQFIEVTRCFFAMLLPVEMALGYRRRAGVSYAKAAVKRHKIR